MFVCFVFFFLTICEKFNQAENEHKECYYRKTMNFLLKAIIQGLLIELSEVLRVSKNVARFFPLMFEVRGCQVGLFPIPRRSLPSLVRASRVWGFSLLAEVFLELGRRA